MVEFGGRSTLEGGGSGAREWEAVGKYSKKLSSRHREESTRPETNPTRRKVGKKAIEKRGQLAGSVKAGGLELVPGGSLITRGRTVFLPGQGEAREGETSQRQTGKPREQLN